MAKSLAEITAELNNSLRTVTIDQADMAPVMLPNNPLGALSEDVIGVLMAQRVSLVSQPYYEYSIAKGIGELGLNITQLVDAGLINPDIIPALAGTNTNEDPNGVGLVAPGVELNEQAVYDAVTMPASWTANMDIPNLQFLLRNKAAQYRIQHELYARSYATLLRNNVITTYSSAQELCLAVGLAGIYGTETTVEFIRSQQ